MFELLNDGINNLLVASVVLLITIYFYVLWGIRNEWYSTIKGYWHIDPEFAKMSSLKSGGIIINNYFALELDNDTQQITAMLDEGDFSISADWWLIPTFGSKKYYSMKISTDNIDKLGNFFDSEEMKNNIRIEIDKDELYLYCHDTLYVKAFKFHSVSDMIINGCQPDVD
jgi:hypothetical protein